MSYPMQPYGQPQVMSTSMGMPTYKTRQEALVNPEKLGISFLQPAICSFYVQGMCKKERCLFVHPCKEDIEQYGWYQQIAMGALGNSKIIYPAGAKLVDVRYGEMHEDINPRTNEKKIFSTLPVQTPMRPPMNRPPMHYQDFQSQNPMSMMGMKPREQIDMPMQPQSMMINNNPVQPNIPIQPNIPVINNQLITKQQTSQTNLQEPIHQNLPKHNLKDVELKKIRKNSCICHGFTIFRQKFIHRKHS